MAISDEAKELRNQYMRDYRRKNKERILEKQKEYYKNDPERYKAYRESYWERKLRKGGAE